MWKMKVGSWTCSKRQLFKQNMAFFTILESQNTDDHVAAIRVQKSYHLVHFYPILNTSLSFLQEIRISTF